MRRLDEDDDNDGVGYISNSHLLRPTTLEDRQQTIALLQVPSGRTRTASLSSSVSDIDNYSTENLTQRQRPYVPPAVSTFFHSFVQISVDFKP